MLSRLFSLVIVCALVIGGFYLWRSSRGPSAEWVPGAIRDSAVGGAVETALDLNRQLRPYDIRADVDGDTVTLSGQVPTPELKQRAESVAETVPGIESVSNELEVDPDLPPPPPTVERTLGERVDDFAIEMRARLAFALDSQLEGTDIQVTSYHGELTLAGAVTSVEQRAHALSAARDLSGVTGVTDRMRVRGESDAEGDRSAVARALAESETLKGHPIVVDIDGAKLVLRGRVASEAERELAMVLAHAAASLAVVDELTVGP